MRVRKYFYILLSALLVFMGNSTVWADSVKMNNDTRELTVAAELDHSDYALVQVIHRESGAIYFADLVTVINGTATSGAGLADGIPAGDYDVKIKGNGDDLIVLSFYYASPEVYEELLAELLTIQALASEEQTEQLLAWLYENNRVLAVDLEALSELQAKETLCIECLSEKITDLSTFIELFSNKLSIKLKEEKITFALTQLSACDMESYTALFTEYAPLFNITLGELYRSYSSYVNTFIKSANPQNEVEMREAYEKAMLLPTLNELPRDEILTLLELNDHYFGVYDEIDAQNENVQVLILKRLEAVTYTSVSQLKNDVEKIISENKASSTTTKGNGGGGGGAGGGLKVDASIYEAKPTIAPNADDKRNQEKTEIFSDLENVAWAKESINSLYEKGIISGKGEGKFAPAEYVTRAELMKMLVTAFEVEKGADNGIFFDVLSDAWYFDYVTRAAAAGIATGYESGEFRPEENVKREDLAVFLYRCLGLETVKEYQRFADDENISEYAKDAVYALFEMEAINGVGENFFAPEKFSTRAECAKVINFLLEKVK